ncbi:Uncharacterized protein PECH_003756 [Penicillium ucsense]|uniref:Uncharacterized protein n=1 Tax=Penicillium ucsense TaxID=2839758 RepID=A0A8J8WEC1_9EURO|nr:Uncharacterized protein PECM_003167 [Penicillium ucsense]KAF7729181.1 Uncharacterized protein PECH_003756 [Penicillium ucsense]
MSPASQGTTLLQTHFSMAQPSESTHVSELEHNIIIAADQGRLDIVTKLLDGGTDPNTSDTIGTTALHNAAKQGHWHIARLLLERKASSELRDGHDKTAIDYAIQAGHRKVVHLLLECDPGPRTGRELCLAARCGHLDIVQDLLDHGAPTLAPVNRSTPLHVAAMQGHHEICDVLLAHDKRLNRSIWERMTGPKLAVDSRGALGRTPFSWAVTKNHTRTVEVFLQHYPSLVGSFDHKSKMLCFFEAIEAKNVEMVRAFLDHGVDVEMKNEYRQRPLHRAVAAGSIEIIQMLLDKGAATDQKSKVGCDVEMFTYDPKIKMMLRNSASARSKGSSSGSASARTAAPPPPEYKA